MHFSTKIINSTIGREFLVKGLLAIHECLSKTLFCIDGRFHKALMAIDSKQKTKILT
jgi:hypothetical protein